MGHSVRESDNNPTIRSVLGPGFLYICTGYVEGEQMWKKRLPKRFPPPSESGACISSSRLQTFFRLLPLWLDLKRSRAGSR